MTQTITQDSQGINLYATDDTPNAPVASGDKVVTRDIAVGRNATFGGTVTPTGGIVSSGRSRFSTIPIGSVAYGSLGTDGLMVANTIYVADIFIPRNITLTGIGMLQGTTSATDKYVYMLFASAGGAPLVTTAAAGVVADGNTDAFLEIPFTAPYAAVGPARYWIGIQCNGTTTKNRKIAASTYIDVLTKSYTNATFVQGPLTVPTTFSPTVGPIAYVY